MMTDPHQSTDNRFAFTDEEAEARFQLYKSSDPFPSIPPALLNSADISDYVAATGMIHPFEDNNKRLKSASYLVNLQGECIYWDDEGQKRILQLNDENDKLELKPNSIVFITPEPTFRLPDFIAVRFNLEIRHIHKGILLGTGPLVDPGFTGKLLVPLHNLTTNTYIFRGGDPIIWMEFTKLSPNGRWDRVSGLEFKARQGVFRGFPPRKNISNVERYLEKALENAIGNERQIRSSIPAAIGEANRLAHQAEGHANKAKREIQRFQRTIQRKINNYRNYFTIAAVFTTIVTAVAILVPLYSLIHQVNTSVSEAAKEIPLLRKEIQSLEERLKVAEQKLQSVSPQESPDSAAKPATSQKSAVGADRSNNNDGQGSANTNR